MNILIYKGTTTMSFSWYDAWDSKDVETNVMQVCGCGLQWGAARDFISCP